jgi:hypothetical protein
VIAAVAALAVFGVLAFSGRYLYVAIVQEGRPALVLAALRIRAGALVVTVDDNLFLAAAAMERADGDWPIRKHLQSTGLVFEDQLGAMLVFRDATGRQVRFLTRMFTREMMVVERVDTTSSR